MNILVIDVGGTNIKIFANGANPPVKVQSGAHMTAEKMVKAVLKMVAGVDYSAVSIGYPGPVTDGRPAREPHNLGNGWVGFDFDNAFEKRVKMINDAAMQAVGSYQGGRMLFLGLGTGLGSTLIVDGVIAPLELAHLPYRGDRTLEECVGVRVLKRKGLKKWRRAVFEIAAALKSALQVDDVVLGGGNAKHLTKLPQEIRLVQSWKVAYLGGCRLWERPTSLPLIKVA
jgi:polyphosphate glucokinase